MNLQVSHSGILVLAANRQHVRFFQAPTDTAPISELSTFTNGGISATASESHSSTKNAPVDHPDLEPRNDGHPASDVAFAKRIATRVSEIRTSGELTRLHLVADPRMLGLLRNALSKDCMRLVASETGRDPGHDDAVALRKHLPDKL